MSACAAAGCSRAQAVCCFAGWNSRRFEPKRTSLQICSHACSVTQHAVVFSTFGDPNVQSSGHLVILDNAGNLLWDTLLPNPGPFALSAISLFEFVHDELLLVTVRLLGTLELAHCNRQARMVTATERLPQSRLAISTETETLR